MRTSFFRKKKPEGQNHKVTLPVNLMNDKMLFLRIKKAELQRAPTTRHRKSRKLMNKEDIVPPQEKAIFSLT